MFWTVQTENARTLVARLFTKKVRILNLFCTNCVYQGALIAALSFYRPGDGSYFSGAFSTSPALFHLFGALSLLRCSFTSPGGFKGWLFEPPCKGHSRFRIGALSEPTEFPPDTRFYPVHTVHISNGPFQTALGTRRPLSPDCIWRRAVHKLEEIK